MKEFDKSCDQCLMGKNRIVSENRASQIIGECLESSKHFVCHKATLKGQDIACAGFLKKHGKDLRGYELCKSYGLVEVVPLDKFVQDAGL